jgi:hypothetical protein
MNNKMVKGFKISDVESHHQDRKTILCQNI